MTFSAWLRKAAVASAAFAFASLTAVSAPKAAAMPDEIVIGLIPEENIFRQYERHIPLAEYLSLKTGIKVRFTILSRYGDIIDRFANQMDGAFFDSFTGLLALEKLRVEPIARPINIDGKSTVQGYIIARKDGGIKTLDDIKGKRAAFVDRAASTGYVYPMALLRRRGVKDMEGHFSSLLLTGSYDSVVFKVLDRQADVGATKSNIFERLISKDPVIRDELIVIAESPPLPDSILCLKTTLPKALRERIKDTLLNISSDPRGKQALQKLEIQGFVGAVEADFEPIRRLVKDAEIDLKTYRYR